MKELKQIVITGISSELGGILARSLALKSDVEIIGTMRRKKTQHDKFPANVSILDNCDITKLECCHQVAEIVKQNFNNPFGFIHSVGDFWDHVPFEEFETENASRMFESHVTTLDNYFNL